MHPFFRAAATGRADVVCMGDSNQLFGSTGWDHGWAKALSDRFGLYATGLVPAGDNQGNGSGLGYQYSASSTISSGAFLYSNAPAPLDVYLTGNMGIAPLFYLYLSHGNVAGQQLNHGLFVDRFSSLDVNASLRFSLSYGLFPDGNGSFRLVVREGQFPYANLAISTPLSTGSSEYGVAMSTIDLPTAARDSALNLRFSTFDSNFQGPFLAHFMRMENRDRSRGAALHTLYAQGGQSARDMAASLLTVDDQQLSFYFSQVRSLQGANPVVLMRINMGLNDRNENLPSVGPNQIANGSSPAALADNILAIVERLQGIWSLNGWNESELIFLITVSHPVSNPDQPILEQYRAAAAELATNHPSIVAVNMGVLTAWGEMVANGWYQVGGFDPNHLTQAGFESLAARELESLEDGACWRDLNHDGVIDIRDMEEWHILKPDLNGDGIGDAVDLRCLQKAVRAGELGDIAPVPLP